MIDPKWYDLVPLVAEQSEFHAGLQAGGRHWWDDWQGEAADVEIAAFLAEDWSYAWVMQRNQEALALGVLPITEAFAAGFVLGWFGAVCGE